MYFPLIVGVLCLSLFCYVLLCVHSICEYNIMVILKFSHLEEEEKAGCFAIIVLQMYCTINGLWLFLNVPWVNLQYAIVVFLDHTEAHLLF